MSVFNGSISCSLQLVLSEKLNSFHEEQGLPPQFGVTPNFAVKDTGSQSKVYLDRETENDSASHLPSAGY